MLGCILSPESKICRARAFDCDRVAGECSLPTLFLVVADKIFWRLKKKKFYLTGALSASEHSAARTLTPPIKMARTNAIT